MTSPASPSITTAQYVSIYELLLLNPTAENTPIREEISRYLIARQIWQDDAESRKTGTPW